MRSQAPDLIGRLVRYGCQKCRVIAGITGAGKDEFLPDQKPPFIAQIIEVIRLVEAAASSVRQGFCLRVGMIYRGKDARM